MSDRLCFACDQFLIIQGTVFVFLIAIEAGFKFILVFAAADIKADCISCACFRSNSGVDQKFGLPDAAIAFRCFLNIQCCAVARNGHALHITLIMLFSYVRIGCVIREIGKRNVREFLSYFFQREAAQQEFIACSSVGLSKL